MSWPTTRLADHCEVITKGTTPTTLGHDFTDMGVAFLRVQNIEGGSVTIDRDTLFIDENTHRILERSQIRPGDVLVSIAGTIGRAGVVPDEAPPLNCNQAVAIVRVRNNVHRPFLRHWLESSGAQAQMRGATVTGTISNLSLTQLGNLGVPLPPLREQRRIAEILDKADELRAKRRAAIAKLDTLTQSIFLDMFGDPATNPKKWRVSALETVASTTSGGTPDRSVTEYFGGGIPWVKSGELHQGVVTATEESLTKRGLAESSAKLMPCGTVLVAMYGATVGAVAILGIEAATNQAICCIQPTREMDGDYIVQLLRWMSPSLLVKRVGGAQPNLSQELLRKLKVPIPPLEIQRNFAHRVSEVGKLRFQYRTAITELDELFTSLQDRAFRGDL